MSNDKEESKLDRLLKTAAGRLLSRLEEVLVPESAAIVLLYNRVGADLDLSIVCIKEQAGETLKILRTAIRMLLRDATAGSAERWFKAPGTGTVSPSDYLVSSMSVGDVGTHDRVLLWSRGGLAGELILELGDGKRLAEALALEEAP